MVLSRTISQILQVFVLLTLLLCHRISGGVPVAPVADARVSQSIHLIGHIHGAIVAATASRDDLSVYTPY